MTRDQRAATWARPDAWRATLRWLVTVLLVSLSGCAGAPAGRLARAAQRGDLASMRIRLADGDTVDARDIRGRTALSYAAAAGRLDAMRLLLDQGADPNLRDARGWTPLHYAAAVHDITYVRFALDLELPAARLLLERGARATPIPQPDTSYTHPTTHPNVHWH